MEPIRRRPQDLTPGRPLSGRARVPAGHRPVFSDFTRRPQSNTITPTTRPPGTPAPIIPQTAPPVPHSIGKPTPSLRPAPPQPQSPVPRPRPAPVQPAAPLQQSETAQRLLRSTAMTAAQPQPPQTPAIVAPPTTSIGMPAVPSSEQRPPRPFAVAPKALEHRAHASRAGLVGFACFILLSGLLLSPFLPSKTFDSFPGSSQSSSNGDDSLACIHELQQASTTTAYNHKLGSPITYSYTTTTTQKATCDDKPLTAIAGHTGQFNPLGLLIDIALATAVAIVVAKIWRRVADKRD